MKSEKFLCFHLFISLSSLFLTFDFVSNGIEASKSPVAECYDEIVGLYPRSKQPFTTPWNKNGEHDERQSAHIEEGCDHDNEPFSNVHLGEHGFNDGANKVPDHEKQGGDQNA